MKKTFKKFNTFLVLLACSTLSMVLTSCKKENFDAGTDSSGTTSSTVKEIVIPNNDSKLIVSVSPIDMSTFQDIEATIRMNGEILTGLGTWTAPSLTPMTLYFTAEASGYYTGEKIFTTPALSSGELVYIPIVIGMREQNSTDPIIIDDPEEYWVCDTIMEKPNELKEILEAVKQSAVPITISMTAQAPKDRKLENRNNFEEAVSCITWDEPIIDYTKMFPPESKGTIEETTVKNVKDKLYAWAENYSEFKTYDAVLTDLTLPENTIDIDVQVISCIRCFTGSVYTDIDVDGKPKTFGIDRAALREVHYNRFRIFVKTDEHTHEFSGGSGQP
ncbi:MAG: hypothetical protein Q4E55_02940 [Bacteroidales bacterium]|nr:hypothetical protein [Bacteroidales bacterium]